MPLMLSEVEPCLVACGAGQTFHRRDINIGETSYAITRVSYTLFS